MKPLVPAPPLTVGDTVATVAASSAIPDNERLLQGLSVLESWGLICRRSDVVGRHWGYLAGTDQERRGDFLTPESVSLLACARGGWGAARLLELDLPWQPALPRFTRIGLFVLL